MQALGGSGAAIGDVVSGRGGVSKGAAGEVFGVDVGEVSEGWVAFALRRGNEESMDDAWGVAGQEGDGCLGKGELRVGRR